MKYSYKIDTQLLPKVWVTWASTKNRCFNKRYYLNCQTGKKKTNPEPWMHYDSESDMYLRWNSPAGTCGLDWRSMKNENIWVKSGSAVRYAYVKYHKDIDMLEVAAVGMKTTRAEEIHHWEYLGDRYFIDRNKFVVNQDGNVVSNYYVYEYHNAYSVNELLGMLLRLNYNDNAVNEFKKFIGNNYFTIGNGRCVDISHLWHIREWYKTSQKARGKGKEQKLTDMLTAIPLSDISGLAKKYSPEVLEETGWYKREIRHIMYFERVNDEWSVLRQLHRNSDNQLDELCRIYINDNGRNRIVAPSKDQWIPATKARSHWNTYYKLVNKDEASEKCSRVKYALEALSFMEKEKVADALITTMKFPEIEQLLKLGCTRAAKCMLNTSTPKADIKRFFGDYYNDKEKNILKKIGLTKRQLDFFTKKLDEKGNNGWSYISDSDIQRALAMMRGIFGNDLSYMDDESYKRYLNGFVQIKRYFWRGINPYIDSIGVDGIRFVKNLVRLGEKREEIYNIVHDTIHAYAGLNYGTAPEVNWYFDDCSDAIRMHDALVALKNEQDAERRAMWDMEAAERRKKEEEKRIKIDKDRKKYEYEDDEYIIRLPKDSNEIISEGSIQHICIGSYTSRHANGQTNLFLLRKKSEPEFPFYAIEMNNNSIVQIHGSCNKWLGCNPEAIPTVVRWLRKNGIRCDEKILTCTSTGYSRTNNYVPMPVVD